MSRTLQEELVHFLSDVYAIERQALAQLESAPRLAADESLARAFSDHHTETEQQAGLVRERLEAQGGSPSGVKDAVMKLGGKGFLLFARAQPETPGRLVAHAYAYEAMEWAAYEVLTRLAEAAGDTTTVEVARKIRSQEGLMMDRLEGGFDAVEEACHRGLEPEELDSHLQRHLAEAHAIETQGTELLKKSEDIAGDPELERLYRRHFEESREHQEKIERRLDSMGGDTSGAKDAALKLGALNWGYFFQAQSDSPAKLAGFVYAFEHLEIASYELLRRTARRAADTETDRLCVEILEQERAMADRVSGSFDAAARATLEAVAG